MAQTEPTAYLYAGADAEWPFPPSGARPIIFARMKTLEPLIDEAWRIHRMADSNNHDFMVRPSIPILFFGDSDRYWASDLRIVTVGLNPSCNEFPQDDPLRRFPAAYDYRHSLTRIHSSPYTKALNDYFRADPYENWFSCYEPILQGIGASYYDHNGDTALHTDLFSPLATDPTWSKLTSTQRGILVEDGRKLWHQLIRGLRPDIMLISVATRHLDDVQFTRLGDRRLVYTIERTNPFHVWATELEILRGHTTTMVFGRAAQLPFGTVSRHDKQRIGAALRKQRDEG